MMNVTPSVIGRYAGAACPSCAKPVDIHQEAGSWICPACRSRFLATPFTPRIERGALPVPLTDLAAPCAQHAANRAEASCDRCGVFMCTVCRVDTDGRCLCPPCFDRLAEEGALPSVVVRRRNWNGMALHLSLFSWFPFIGLLLGPAAIAISIRGLRYNFRTGERLSHAAGWISIPMALVGIGVSVLVLLGMTKAFK